MNLLEEVFLVTVAPVVGRVLPYSGSPCVGPRIASAQNLIFADQNESLTPKDFISVDQNEFLATNLEF